MHIALDLNRSGIFNQRETNIAEYIVKYIFDNPSQHRLIFLFALHNQFLNSCALTFIWYLFFHSMIFRSLLGVFLYCSAIVAVRLERTIFQPRSSVNNVLLQIKRCFYPIPLRFLLSLTEIDCRACSYSNSSNRSFISPHVKPPDSSK